VCIPFQNAACLFAASFQFRLFSGETNEVGTAFIPARISTDDD
jgi:hypothetical protein